MFPQLVFSQLTDLSDYRKAQIDKNIKAGIVALQNFQRNDGGFSYWPGGQESDEWGSNYAGHFLMEARNRGYTVSEQMLQQWKLFERTGPLHGCQQPIIFMAEISRRLIGCICLLLQSQLNWEL